jgi:hypothetical protein
MSSVEAVTIHVVSRSGSLYMSSVEGRQDTCRHRNSAGKIYSAEQVDSIQQNEEIVARINTRQIRKSYNTDLIKISFNSRLR